MKNKLESFEKTLEQFKVIIDKITPEEVFKYSLTLDSLFNGLDSAETKMKDINRLLVK